jgi:phage baseplate assembly protein W
LSSTVASLSEALKAPSAPTLQGVKSLEPLLTALPVDSTVLASSLRNALSMSGLFYESHLVQWSLGERRLEDIQKESRLRLSSMAKDIKKSADGKISQDPDNLMEDIKNILTTEQGDELQRPQKSIAALSDHVPASLLREQVEILLTGIFRWQGHVWLDQEMEWEVEKHPGERDQESAQSWRTTIRLTLPNLGEVSATLVSSDEGITGRITTDSMESKNVLKQEVSLLEERMAASGLNLTSMIIEHRDGR